MSSDDFEKRVERAPLRQIPPDWRQEILRTATACVRPAPKPVGLLSTLEFQLRALLWPHPRVWAGLAAIWVAVLSFHLAAREDAPAMAKAPTTRETIMAIRQQKWLMTQLNETGEFYEAVRPRSAIPRPRSERRLETTTV